MPPRQFLGLPAPAKINWFLHVLGRRADGYHEIQSVFAPVDLCDTLDFALRADEEIVRAGDLTGPPGADLALRAAQALRAHARATRSGPGLPGVTIEIEKRIPVGAGLGGGSSDAATTLIALNRLWGLDLSRPQLAVLGRTLGADVPFFLGHGAAFVEGIGERCAELALPPRWYVVVFPQVHVSTAEIFAAPELTRNSKGTTILGFSATLSHPEAGLFGANDLEDAVRRRFGPVDAALRLLRPYGSARMSGSGSAVFCMFAEAEAARGCAAALRQAMPSDWGVWAVPGLEELPLAGW